MFVLLSSIMLVIMATPVSDFLSSQLFGVIVGSLLTASLSFLLSLYLNRQQKQRDDRAYKRQVEREKETYIRSLKDAKRERLRSSYKVLLNTADASQVEAQQFAHMPSAANITLTGVDEAVSEISLEDSDTDVLSIFFELRGAFHAYDVLMNTPVEGAGEEVIKHNRAVPEKYEQLKTAMNRHLKELES